MDPLIVIYFEKEKRGLLISPIGIFLTGFTVFTAVHLFFTLVYFLWLRFKERIEKRNRKFKFNPTSLPRGGSNNELDLPNRVVDIVHCIKQPGMYEIIHAGLKMYLRERLELFRYKTPVIIDQLTFLLAFYGSQRLGAKIKQVLVSRSVHILVQNYQELGLQIPLLLMSGAVSSLAVFKYVLPLLLPNFTIVTQLVNITFSLFLSVSIYSGVLLKTIQCSDYVRFYPIAEPPKEIVIDAQYAVLLPEERPDMMFLKTAEDAQLIFPEYMSDEVCESSFKYAGIETLEPRGPVQAKYDYQKCTRSRTLKKFDPTIQTADNLKERLPSDDKKAEEAKKRLDKKIEQNLEYFDKKIKNTEQKISIAKKDAHLFEHSNFDE